MSSWTSGTDGIPSGWTIEDYDPNGGDVPEPEPGGEE